MLTIKSFVIASKKEYVELVFENSKDVRNVVGFGIVQEGNESFIEPFYTDEAGIICPSQDSRDLVSWKMK